MIFVPTAVDYRDSNIRKGFKRVYFPSLKWAYRPGPNAITHASYWPNPPFKNYRGSDRFMFARGDRAGWSWFPREKRI